MNKKIYTDNKLIYADITYKARGALFNVYNTLGHGHKEQVYQKALEKEFDDLGIKYQKQASLKVKYKNEEVGKYRPDFVIENKVIIEIKAVEFVPKSYEQQLLHYLKATNYHLGLLVNFGATKLLIKRVIWTV